jgi:hypothetical protein
MRMLTTAMIIVVSATPAFAQFSFPTGIDGGKGLLKTDEDVRQEKERESGYKAGLSKIPAPKVTTDAWGNVRGAASPPPQAKPSKPQPGAK